MSRQSFYWNKSKQKLKQKFKENFITFSGHFEITKIKINQMCDKKNRWIKMRSPPVDVWKYEEWI